MSTRGNTPLGATVEPDVSWVLFFLLSGIGQQQGVGVIQNSHRDLQGVKREPTTGARTSITVLLGKWKPWPQLRFEFRTAALQVWVEISVSLRAWLNHPIAAFNQ